MQYREIPASEVPAALRWDTPARNQGQPVEVSYAEIGRRADLADDGAAYRRICDSSDRSTTYYQSVRSLRGTPRAPFRVTQGSGGMWEQEIRTLSLALQSLSCARWRGLAAAAIYDSLDQRIDHLGHVVEEIG